MMKTLGALMTDIVLIIYAFTGLVFLRVYWGGPPEMLDTMLAALGPFVAVHLIALAAFGAYDLRKLRNESDVAFSAAVGSIVGGLSSLIIFTIVLVYYAPNAQPIGRSVFFGAALINLFVLAGWRVWYTKVRRKRGDLRSRVIVAGTGKAVERVSREIEGYSRSGHDIIGTVSVEVPDSDVRGYLGSVEDLPDLVKAHRIDEVLVIGDQVSYDSAMLLRVIRLCDDSPARVYILPGLYEAIVGQLAIREIGGVPLMEIRKNAIPEVYAVVKRVLDVVIAVFGLLLGGPILLACMIGVKLDSRGPILYRQIRCGRHGREFNIIKLRTMRVDAEKETGPVWAGKEDSRITRFGNFLRRKRLDEIPQLWNVIKGDMSMVGPRPERPFFIEKFSREVPLFPLRMRVKPGVTSLSHVWGRYDSEPIDRLRYDLVYMSNVSFWLDIRILIETVKIVLTGRGAQ